MLYNEIFDLLITNYLISTNQPGLKPGESCINQLLSITHEVYASLDEGYGVRDVFLDISNIFGNVWQERLIFKLKQNRVCRKLARLIKDFLSDRKQRVVLNGLYSSWVNVQGGCPASKSKLIPDETSLFSKVTDPNAMENQINNDLPNINTWPYQWKLNFNPDTSKQAQEVIFSCKI